MDEDLAVGEVSDFENVAGGFDLVVAAVVVDGAGYHVGGVLLAELVFQSAPFASVEGGFLRDSITGEEGVYGIGEIGGGGEVAAVEACIGEGFCRE